MRRHSVLMNKNIIFLTIIVLFLFSYIIISNISKNIPDSKIEIKADRLQDFVNVDNLRNNHVQKVSPPKHLKYILLWTPARNVPFVYMGHGQQGFIERNCSFTNCYVTSDKTYLNDITQFDVIAFAGPDLWRISKSQFYNKPEGKGLSFPEKRSPHQKYVFASIESAENYPICFDDFDCYFNWTWTYKLNSDARWGYFDIRDSDLNVVGPRRDMTWLRPEDMKPVPENLRQILNGKTKAAAWFVSNCAESPRVTYFRRLEMELRSYGLVIDVYGSCRNLTCDRSNETKCDEMIEKDYFFYLSFENSFSEDYVTEKLLHAVAYSAIPVVFSGANLTRFLPEGSYLDARALGPKKLAKKMDELIKDREQYAEYFKWRNHYSYHRLAASPVKNEYCGFCALLNNEQLVNKTTVYENFKEWWTPPYKC